jgi:magnesium transporter
MIKFLYYNSSTNEIKKGNDLSYAVPTNNDFIWIFAQRPDDKEIAKISADFGVEQKFFKIFSKESRSVRYSISPLVFVFMDYYLENGHIKNSRILFILKENALIIVLEQPTIFHNELFDQLVDSFKPVKKKSLVRLMYQFLMDDVDENYEVLEKVETTIMDLEKDILHGKHRVEDIIKFKRRIHRMSRRFWGSAKIVFVIKKGLTPLKVDIESTRLLDDVYNTYMHQIDILSTSKEMLSDILAIHNTAVQNDLNLIIKKLTAFTVILLVPTLIAGIYGMNFAYIPEFRWEFGYPFALLSMAVSIAILYYFFHRKKWL